MRVCAIGLRGIPNVMGGIETHCESLYPLLAKLDDSIEIVVIGRQGYVQPGVYRGVSVRTIWTPRQPYLETLIHTPLALLYARLFLRPDLVHLHGVGPGFFTPLARLLGFRTVVTHHAADYERPKWKATGRWFLKTGEYLLAHFANQIICVNSALAGSLKARYPRVLRRTSTVRNGAPACPADVPLADAVLGAIGVAPKQYILAVGRLDATKGFHDLIEAFEIAHPPDMKLVIAGAAPPEDRYAAQLLRKRSDRVFFAGFQTAANLRALYENAALFVHASYMEGFALVILEALSAGAPVILSDITANREFDLEEHLYFPVGDVYALAEKLAPGNYEVYACARSNEVLRENNWDEIARRHLKIFSASVGQDTPLIAA